MRGHRGFAVGRNPGNPEAAILARAQPDRALARLLEDKGVVVALALAAGPGGRMLGVDAGPDRVDRAQIVAMHRFDAEQDLPTVRVEAVPRIFETLRRLGGVAADPRAVLGRGGGGGPHRV